MASACLLPDYPQEVVTVDVSAVARHASQSMKVPDCMRMELQDPTPFHLSFLCSCKPPNSLLHTFSSFRGLNPGSLSPLLSLSDTSLSSQTQEVGREEVVRAREDVGGYHVWEPTLKGFLESRS